MEKRIIITEEERSRISNLHLLNEGILGKLMNRIKNSKIYKKVEKAYDPNPQTFVQNIIKEMPKLEKVKDQLNQKISEISKMSDEEKQKYLEKNNVDLERGIKDIDVKLNEQTTLPPGPAPVGIPYGPIFMVLFVIGLIYILIGINSSMKLKREDPEKYAQMKGQKTDRDEEYEDKLNTLLNKTVNLYTDEEQTKIYSKGIIKEFHLRGTNLINEIPYLRIAFGGRGKYWMHSFIVDCTFNPTKFDDKIKMYDLDYDVNTGGGRDFAGFLYNKEFMNKLTEIAGPWCKKPEADFGSVDKSDDSNLA